MQVACSDIHVECDKFPAQSTINLLLLSLPPWLWLELFRKSSANESYVSRIFSSFCTNIQDANRKKALERLKQRRGENPVQPAKPPLPEIRHRPVQEKQPERVIPPLPRTELTPEQRARIEKNREKALQLQRERHKNHRDGGAPIEVPVVTEQDRKRARSEQNLRPSIQKKDYIEYDFSTMKDSRGGFLDDEKKEFEREEESQTLQEWKEKQKQEHIVRDLAPPLDLANAPKCFECGSLEIDPNFYTNFNNVRVCRKCLRETPDKYALLTKTECREDYLLTEPELKDVAILPRIEKPNPHGFLRMQLFLRFQVEEYAWKKWGSSDGLDAEWERREKARLQRRDKKYQDKLKEIRKKTRAEEYTRKLRNGMSLGERHVHLWSAPLAIGDDEKLVKRRCIDCGIETEEVII